MQYLLKIIDDVLDRITMYRLVLYVLCVLVLAALIEGLFGVIPYEPSAIILSLVLAIATCWVVNESFSRVLGAAKSVESVYITAFIVALILPPATIGDISEAIVVVAASACAMASKYVFAYRKKHIFNPAAFGVAATALLMGGNASWWVAGNVALLPFVLVGGLAITRKIRRFDLVISFFIAATLTIVLTTPSLSVGDAIELTFLHTSLLFFAFIMLTEPFTTPPSRLMRIVYGLLTGILFAPAMHIGNVYSLPEFALLIGNIFVFMVSPKWRSILTLVRVEDTSASTKDFVFTSDKPLIFSAGQYMEWTVPQKKPDARGTRRFFTIASSPTEAEVRLGVKFYPKPSTFKQELLALTPGDRVSAAQLNGEFVLPNDVSKKLVCIAGGIGITPFRSHFRYVLDLGQKRDIVLLYANRTPADIAYGSILSEAEKALGTKIVHVMSETVGEGMRKGPITAELVRSEVPDYLERVFYISGPQAMVSTMKSMLRAMGVAHSNIHTDYFIGFA